MIEANHNTENTPMEKRRINISSKRQITIPAKYYEALGFDKEIECIYSNNMLILTPVKKENSAFAEEILADLIKQGFSGEKLLVEFKKINRQVRPAIEKLIEEADEIASVASANYVDPTDDIFGDNETEAQNASCSLYTIAEKYFKKLKDKQLKQIYKEAINCIRENPQIGDAKIGDLNGIYSLDIRHNRTSYELAYRISQLENGDVVVIIMAGTRENFYTELKRYMK